MAVPARPKHRKILGDNLRRIRKAAHLSQEALAEKADLHPVFVGEVERGVKNISVDALVQIAGGLKIPAADLLEGI